MYEIISYQVTPNLFGRPRWQAEITNQHVRFCRRSYSRKNAEEKIRRDENAYWDDNRPETLMQTLWLPMTIRMLRLHDKACRWADKRRKARRG